MTPVERKFTNSTFKPAWWLKNRHLQTIFPTFFRFSPRVKTTAERLELPDGDFLDLNRTPGHSGPIVIILHGLEGSVDSAYVQGMLAAIREKGWRAVLMHFRNCSKVPNRLMRTYHSGDTGDVGYLIEVLRQREPETPLAAVGYSIGGNVLLKYLGEKGQNTPLMGAAAVSVPFMLDRAATRLNAGVPKVYQWYLLRHLRQAVIRKASVLAQAYDIKRVHSVKTLKAFDNEFTAPIHGFRDADHYYHESSCLHFIKHIRVKTLICHSLDDPFMYADVIPKPQMLPDCVQFDLSPKGGHVGFISGKYPWLVSYWLEKRIPSFFDGVWSI